MDVANSAECANPVSNARPTGSVAPLKTANRGPVGWTRSDVPVKTVDHWVRAQRGSASAFRIAPIKRAEVMAVEVRVAAAVRECTVSKANVWRRILAGRAQRDSPARKTVDANVPRSRGVGMS